jgi:hypothetical protein
MDPRECYLPGREAQRDHRRGKKIVFFSLFESHTATIEADGIIHMYY